MRLSVQLLLAAASINQLNKCKLSALDNVAQCASKERKRAKQTRASHACRRKQL